MKKNILFVLESYDIGGTTVSTRNLVEVLNQSKEYSINILCLNDEGLLKDIYNDCNIIKTCLLARMLMMPTYKKCNNLCHKIIAMGVRFLSNHCTLIKRFFYSIIERKCLKEKVFDIVVACAEGKTTDFVYYLNHSNKISWIRCDYKNYYSKEIIEQRKSIYEKFKYIVCVSHKTKEGFIEVYPDYAEKTFDIHNPQDEMLLLKLASIDDHDIRFRTDKISIVSVGRIDKIKRFSFIPSIASSLRRKGLDFYWYIIGDGSKIELDLIYDEIKKNNADDYVILLGAKSNAHFYIKKSDLLVVTSLSEACPRVINEAKILNTPIVSTDFRTIDEYIENNETGIISPLETIDEAIYRLLNNRILYNKISNNISSFTFNNSELLKKIQMIL